MAKLSRKQIIAARRQAKETRSNLIDELSESDPELAQEKRQDLEKKKDKMGFTREDREQITEKKSSIDKKSPKVSWNFNEGDLVYIPGNCIGIIVKNNARDVELSNYHSLQNPAERNAVKHAGRVYVVTASGNNWFYPKQLKAVR